MSSIRCENLKGGRNGGQTKRENIRKFGMGRLEITKDEKARGGVSKECGAGGDEWGRTAFVQRTKEIRAINGVGRVPTIFIGSAHRSIHRVRRNNAIRNHPYRDRCSASMHFRPFSCEYFRRVSRREHDPADFSISPSRTIREEVARSCLICYSFNLFSIPG